MSAERLRRYLSFLDYDLAKAYVSIPSRPKERMRDHVDAAVSWICQAQDAAGDGGVARSYSLVYNSYFRKKGWVPSYPETTGYIIPTMFDYANLLNREDIRRRAIRMADWECQVQMGSGAVQGGTIDQPPTPAIFNTGQVIFGWVRAYEETLDRKYIESAIRAGKYLLEQQDPDGAWRKNLSRYASAEMESYTYNTRTAWSLLVLSKHDGSLDFPDSAIRNIEHSLTKQTANGWFHLNCLGDPRQPLLHTIAYCIRGILEAGACLNKEKYIESARLAADAVMSRMEKDGSLAGRFDEGWRPAVKWGCLTGDAQMSTIWSRMFQLTGDRKYLNAAKKINRYLRSVQLVGTKNPDLFGGIAGSYPLHGEYGRYEILNWAVKYFIDAMLLEHAIDPGEPF